MIDTKIPHRIKNDPDSAIGLPVGRLDEFDWDECFPAISNGHVVAVISAHDRDVAGYRYDSANDYYVPAD